MKYIIALLLGISAYVKADEYSFDSNENEVGDDTSYNGFVFTVNDGNVNVFPRIRFQTELNEHSSTYCFDMLGLFESEDYPLDVNTNPSYSMVTNTEITFDANQCTVDNTTITSTHFDINCNIGSHGALLLASFNFVADNEDADGNDGLEYTLTLSDYVLSSNTSKLIISQSLKDCSTEYKYSADSDEQTDDGSNDADGSIEDEEEDDGSIEATEEPKDAPSQDEDPTRRLADADDDGDSADTNTGGSNDGINAGSVSDSKEEADGVSSDDSGEIDVGLAQFLKTGEAHDICYNDLNNGQGVDSNDVIQSNVVYITKEQQIQIVFDNFDCTLQLDPFIGYDKEKLDDGDSSAVSFSSMIAIFIAFIVVFL